MNVQYTGNVSRAIDSVSRAVDDVSIFYLYYFIFYYLKTFFVFFLQFFLGGGSKQGKSVLHGVIRMYPGTPGTPCVNAYGKQLQ